MKSRLQGDPLCQIKRDNSLTHHGFALHNVGENKRLTAVRLQVKHKSKLATMAITYDLFIDTNASSKLSPKISFVA